MANGILNAAATMQECKGFNTGLIDQTNSGTLSDMHNIKLWRTSQDELGLYLIHKPTGLKILTNSSFVWDPRNHSQEGITFTLTLTTNRCLINFTMNEITNYTNTATPTVGNLKIMVVFYHSSRS